MINQSNQISLGITHESLKKDVEIGLTASLVLDVDFGTARKK